MEPIELSNFDRLYLENGFLLSCKTDLVAKIKIYKIKPTCKNKVIPLYTLVFAQKLWSCLLSYNVSGIQESIYHHSMVKLVSLASSWFKLCNMGIKADKSYESDNWNESKIRVEQGKFRLFFF